MPAGGWNPLSQFRSGSGLMDFRIALRRTLKGALIGAAVFAAASVYRSLSMGASPLDHLGPVTVMTVIGGTVGGLVGPLLGGLANRRKSGG